MKRWVKRIVWCATTLLAVLGGGCATARLVSNWMLFAPPAPSYTTLQGLTMIPGEGGAQFAAVYLPNPQARRLVILFHGNGDDLGYCWARIEGLNLNGFAVLAVEYPGYGRTGGTASEGGLYASADAAYRYATTTLNWAPQKVVPYGVSLGGAGAMWIASRKPVGGLILESAFTGAYAVVLPGWRFLGDRMPNLERMKTVRCSVFILQGTKDGLVNWKHGRKLFAAAPEPKRAFWVEGAGHNNVLSTAGPRYWQELRDFTDSLPR
jgi:abhydrolase domain-containing protein 17